MQEAEQRMIVENNSTLLSESEHLKHELTRLESENDKTAQDNKALRAKIMRMDKLVYGKAKSPHKRFYL